MIARKSPFPGDYEQAVVYESASLGIQVPLSFPKNGGVAFSTTDPEYVLLRADL